MTEAIHTFISQTFCSNLSFGNLSFDTITVGYTVIVHVMDRLDNINNYIITVVQYLLLLRVHESLLPPPPKQKFPDGTLTGEQRL